MRERAYKKWTAEEDDYLQDSWGTHSPQGIAHALGRTTLSVVVRAKQKHLGSFTGVGVYINRNQAACMVNVDNNTIKRSWEVYHGLEFKKKQARSNGKTQYLIKFDDFIKWLEEHQELWDSRKVEQYALGYEPEWLVKKRKRDSENTNKLRGAKYTPEEDAKIVMYLKQDKTQKEIGELLKRSEASVNARIGRLDVWGTGKLKKG